VLQHEWKPTTVVDLSIKSRAVNSSALSSESAAWGNPSLRRCYCEALRQHQVTHLAEGQLRIPEECGNLG